MKVFLTLADEQRAVQRDAVIHADTDAPVAELVQAIDSGSEPWQWRVDRRLLRGDERMGDVLCDGAFMARGGSDSVPDGGDAGVSLALRVVSGPDAGASWDLAPGRYTLGRGGGVDLSLRHDLQVSRHHADVTVLDDALSVCESESSKNGILVGGSRVHETTVGRGQPFQMGESVFAWSRDTEERRAVVVADGAGELTFNRPPRIHDAAHTETVTFPGAPPERQRNPFPLVGVLAPIGIGVLMALLLKRPEFLLFTLLSPIMAVSNFFSSNRRGKGSYAARKQDYDRSLTGARQKIERTIERQEAVSREAFPDPDTVARIARLPESRLWERREGDDDFLSLRFGLSRRRAEIAVAGSPPSDVDLEPVLDLVPETLDLRAVGVLGIAGPRASCEGLARWLLAQAATFHAPGDLSVTILTERSQEEAWSWARWLPHVRPEAGRCTAQIGSTDAAAARMASELAETLEDRLHAEGVRASEPSDRVEQVHLVVLDGAYRLGSLPAVARLLRNGPRAGIYFVCLDDSEHLLPEECQASAIFSAAEPTRLDLRVSRGAQTTSVLADRVPSAWAEVLARALAPIRLSRRAETVTLIPTTLRLLDLLGLEDPDAERIVEGWRHNGRTTKAVIGRQVTGTMAVDLRTDGPHGLIAGTTGSGKSEFLQTLIASLAVANRPDAMSFVLIDYKGGSAFKDCAELPHTVGMVTDLDGHLTERALASLAAELRRRERLLQRTGTKDIEDYWDLDEGSRPEPLARLALVIDEFAALAEELPAFVEGLVDLARRGRSLGIHLVLATQRPSGVVSPAIRTNTNLRVALRVTDAADSIDVIDSPLASRISKEIPGRAYLRVGHENLSEFQSARVGGHRRVEGNQKLEVRPVDWTELGDLQAEPTRDSRTAEDTDLSVLVNAVRVACVADQIEPPKKPWLDPLPPALVLDEEPPVAPASLTAVFGVEDRPSAQEQVPATWDIAAGGHLLAVGDAGSGRSTFLRTLAASVARRCPTRDVHLYGIDCGNGALLPLQDLPHCGAVVSRTEHDRVDRLLARLLDEVSERQRILSLGGFSSIADQRRAAEEKDRLPYVVVLVDRWEGFVAEFDALDAGRMVSAFLHLMKEAPGVGIRIVLSGDKTAMSARVSSLVPEIFVLRLNDRGNYALVGIQPRTLPDKILPGRCFRGGSGIEVQVGLLSDDPSGPAQAEALRAVASAAAARDAGTDDSLRPQPLGVLPQVVLLDQLWDGAAVPPGNDMGLLVGAGGDRIEPLWVDLRAVGPAFVVGGPPRSGRSNALAIAARCALAQSIEVLIVCGRPSPLAALAPLEGVVGVVEGATATRETAADILGDTSRRLLVVVDDAEYLSDSALAEPLTAFIRGARDAAHAVVVGGTTTEMVGGFRGFVPEAKKSKTGLLLCPGAPGDGELLGVRLPRTAVFPGPAGRGILTVAGSLVTTQVPLDSALGER